MDYIGKHVKRFESGSKGSTALESCGNDYGLSCGSYQLTLRWGNCTDFLKKYFPDESASLYFNKAVPDKASPTYPGPDYCSSPDAVKAVWMECYHKVGADTFFSYEHEYIKDAYYEPAKRRLQGLFDPDSHSRAMQECIWSWAVHRGPSGMLREFKAAIQEEGIASPQTADKRWLFETCYDKRYEITGFTRYSSDGGQSSERVILRDYLDEPPLIEKGEAKTMKIFLCVGHGIYKNGAISSADGTKYGGVNEYHYNKALAPYVKKWLEKAGHKVDMCILPEKVYSSLNDEINYFIGLENKGNYDLSVQLHLNAFNGNAYGAEVYHYGGGSGEKYARQVQDKLKTVWSDRGIHAKPGLYWIRKTKATSILIESFFCDNANDYSKAKKIGMDAHGKLIAEGIHGKSITGGTSGGSSGGSSGSTGKGYLSLGDTGEDVKKMQEMLNKCGFSVGKYGADGSFGLDTRAALVSFQTKYNLAPDGFYGPASKAKLEEVYKKATQPEKPAQKVTYIVQCGAYSVKANAEAQVKRLKAAGFDAIVKKL